MVYFAKELLGVKGGFDIEKMKNELLENPDVQLWLKYLKPKTPPQHWNMVHGSFDFNYENAMYKALQLGLHANIPQLDEALEYYFQYLENENTKSDIKRSLFNSIIIASMLIKAGYRNDTVVNFMKSNLSEVYKFTNCKNYNLYVENRDEYKGLPKNWKEAPILKPEIFKEYGFGFPLVYDMIGLSGMYQLNDVEINKKIGNVVEYIACDDFENNIISGYGIIAEPEEKVPGHARYHGMGWDPKLPGYFNIEEYASINPSRLLFFADIMCDYPEIVRSKWFNNVIMFLEQFITKDGTYCFPKEYLKQKSGYAVQGFHLGLGESRRKKIWCEVESTFRMMRIKRNIHAN